MRPACHSRLPYRTILTSTRSQAPTRPTLRGQPTSRTLSTAPRPQTQPQPKTRANHLNTPIRSFNLPSLSSFLPTSPGNGGNNSPKRVLTATRTLPYTPALLFKVIASVESYSQFLPFLTESTVTARDPETGYPTQAYLTVGYGPLSETFTSRVDCDPANWVVEARSGAKYGKPDGSASSSSSSSGGGLSGFFPGATEGVFEYLSTRWELAPVEGGDAVGGPQTKVNLEVRFEFRNQLHASVMGAVEGQMASVMIEAFEKRIRESHTRGQ